MLGLIRRTSARFYINFPFVLLFAVVFAVLGYFTPIVYRQYFDKTDYIEFLQPVEVDKNVYKACGNVRLNTTATVLLPLQVRTVAVLEQLEDTTTVRVKDYSWESEFRPMAATKISREFSLPCELTPGKYFFTAVIKYNIDRAERNYEWYSETFEVVK